MRVGLGRSRAWRWMPLAWGCQRVGYTFEYINVCNFEAVLEWASAILSGGY